ncbi:hypothetical protein ABTY96_03295 [Streptomyces sp. NPDC096057]|uniref:hypothetical protein n=1 Tax=Streptomyces sp. NPDC096057 TaxID=3155543 RepID=UPI00331C2577
MINGGRTIHTADGSTVSIRPVGIEYDLETRNAKGECIATVRMNHGDLSALIKDAEEVQGW